MRGTSLHITVTLLFSGGVNNWPRGVCGGKRCGMTTIILIGETVPGTSQEFSSPSVHLCLDLVGCLCSCGSWNPLVSRAHHGSTTLSLVTTPTRPARPLFFFFFWSSNEKPCAVSKQGQHSGASQSLAGCIREKSLTSRICGPERCAVVDVGPVGDTMFSYRAAAAAVCSF